MGVLGYRPRIIYDNGDNGIDQGFVNHKVNLYYFFQIEDATKMLVWLPISLSDILANDMLPVENHDEE